MGKWKCEGCGACCKFVTIGVKNVDEKTRVYIAAHGLKYVDGKIIVPARCKYLTEENRCSINDRKFETCKAGGEAECKEAKKNYAKITKKA